MVSDPARPQGGLGRGKDMANVIEAQRKSSNNGEKREGKSPEGKETKEDKPNKSTAKSHRKLTDLDVDNMTESETDEYEASESVPFLLSAHISLCFFNVMKIIEYRVILT